MTIANISNGELGSSVRSKLNAVIDAVNAAGSATITLNALSTFGAGDIGFMDPDNQGDAEIATNASEASSGPVLLGVATAQATSGNPVTLQYSGIVDFSTFFALTANALYYLDTAGGITTTRPTGNAVVRPVGFALSTTLLLLLPSAGYVVLDDGVNRITGATYTLQLADLNGLIETDVAIANTITIPTFASVPWPKGGSFSIAQVNTGLTTLQADTGVVLNRTSANSVTTQGQFTGLSVYKRTVDNSGTASDNDWIALGT